jgi:hypothetical protein
MQQNWHEKNNRLIKQHRNLTQNLCPHNKKKATQNKVFLLFLTIPQANKQNNLHDNLFNKKKHFITLLNVPKRRLGLTGRNEKLTVQVQIFENLKANSRAIWR